jgi:E3 ubiquitin-protein ligase LRSAM1
MVMKLHESRETERNQLITNILEAEHRNSTLVNNLLKLKCGPDPAILELEKQEQDMILERLRIKEHDFRKQEILDAMSELLRQETHTIETYQSQKDHSSRSIIAAESQTNELLTFVYQNYDRNRSAVIEKITGDEVLQKSAVSRLIELNDARSWALVEQLRIVEQQLAALTVFELERKKLSIDEQTVSGEVEGTQKIDGFFFQNHLAAQRIDLTYVLLDLLEQQDQRKKQLFTTLQRMEDQNDDNTQDFWLLQYQKLIDSQPLEVSQQTAAIDPALGHHILVNGVIHTLPFFSKLWLTHQSDLKGVTDADLVAAGLTHQRDRASILRAIEDYLREAAAPSAPPASSQPTTSNFESASAPSPTESPNKVNTYTECVVCMDQECQIIFLPCGHLCCCEQCQVEIGECPMCRGVIENKIKVIRG